MILQQLYADSEAILQDAPTPPMYDNVLVQWQIKLGDDGRFRSCINLGEKGGIRYCVPLQLWARGRYRPQSSGGYRRLRPRPGRRAGRQEGRRQAPGVPRPAAAL